MVHTHIGTISLLKFEALSPTQVLNVGDSLSVAKGNAAVITTTGASTPTGYAIAVGGAGGDTISIVEGTTSTDGVIKSIKGWVYIWSYVSPIRASSIQVAADHSMGSNAMELLIDSQKTAQEYIHCLDATDGRVTLVDPDIGDFAVELKKGQVAGITKPDPTSVKISVDSADLASLLIVQARILRTLVPT